MHKKTLVFRKYFLDLKSERKYWRKQEAVEKQNGKGDEQIIENDGIHQTQIVFEQAIRLNANQNHERWRPP